MTLEEEVVSLLNQKGLTLTAAESCTGGLIAKRLTDVSGASVVFHGSLVTYSNRLKEKWLGVQAETKPPTRIWQSPSRALQGRIPTIPTNPSGLFLSRWRIKTA